MKVFKLMKRGQDKVLANELSVTGLTREHTTNQVVKAMSSFDNIQVEFDKNDLEQLRSIVRQLEQLK